MAANLQQVIVNVSMNGEFASAESVWAITGKVDGFDTGTSAKGAVVAKPITDELKSVIAAVIAQGPPAPPA